PPAMRWACGRARCWPSTPIASATAGSKTMTRRSATCCVWEQYRPPARLPNDRSLNAKDQRRIQMKLISTINAFARGALIAAGLALGLGAAQAQEKVTIQIDGAAVPYYLPMFVADHYGYFKEAGLEVEFLYANAADILNNIAAGNVQFGFPNGDAVISARANGLPVKVVHSTYQRGIGAVLFKTSSGIETPADLEGKKVAVTSYGSPNYIQLQVMMAKADKSIDDVNVEIVGTGAILDALKSDQVDAIVFSMLRYYALQA